MDLKDVVAGARDGDLRAFTMLVDRLSAMAFGYALSLLGDYHLAEDASQDAFVQAYLNLPKLKDPSAFPGCLRRIRRKRLEKPEN